MTGQSFHFKGGYLISFSNSSRRGSVASESLNKPVSNFLMADPCNPNVQQPDNHLNYGASPDDTLLRHGSHSRIDLRATPSRSSLHTRSRSPNRAASPDGRQLRRGSYNSHSSSQTQSSLNHSVLSVRHGPPPSSHRRPTTAPVSSPSSSSLIRAQSYSSTGSLKDLVYSEPFVVYGTILRFWEKKGGINSKFGRPICDERDLPGGGRCGVFEGGHIHYHGTDAAKECVYRLRVQRLNEH